MVRRALGILFLIALPALLAGCALDGRMSKDEYQRELTRITKEVDEQQSIFTEGGQPTEQEIDESADSLDAAADELDEMNPPEEIESTHDDLVNAMHDLAEIIRGDLRSAVANPSAAPPDLTHRMSQILERFQQIDAEYGRQGYQLRADEPSE